MRPPDGGRSSIDLHLHTTASDGVCAPEELVRRAAAAGVRVMSVTDHDTMAAIPEAASAAARHGLEFIPGIEITAVWKGRDVHVLGYYLDHDRPDLACFLRGQREDRRRRLRVMAARLAELGMPIDLDKVIGPLESTDVKSAGRPLIGRALVEAGYVADLGRAFDLWLGEGRAAFVPREGATPAEVVKIIDEAGGLASLAHPGVTRCDEIIQDLARAGLAALEVYHSDHDAETTSRYRSLARKLDLAVSGGSDYHGDSNHHAARLGGAGLPVEDFERLREIGRRRQKKA